MTLNAKKNQTCRKNAIKKWLAGTLAAGCIAAIAVGATWNVAEHRHSQKAVAMELSYRDRVLALEAANGQLSEENAEIKAKLKEAREEIARGYTRTMDVEVTAYTLSAASCGKSVGDPSYGRTATGVNLAGHSLESARAIAVDPDVIPLGSQVQLAFHDETMKEYDGVYTACDTGGAIRGNRVDLFAGESDETLARNIGRRTATARIL